MISGLARQYIFDANEVWLRYFSECFKYEIMVFAARNLAGPELR